MLEGFSRALMIIFLAQAQDLQSPELKLISPGVTFKHAWAYQDKLTELQDDINRVIYEVQTAVSTVLQNSTKETLKQYEDLVNEVQAAFLPTLEQFNVLKPSLCRNSAERILNDTTEFTGFDASNCANFYDIRVRSDIAAANDALQNFDNLYSQVQTIVVKAFIAQNHFVDPEAIEDTITAVFNVVDGRWIAAKPEIEEVRRNLGSAITKQNVELGSCHGKILEDVNWSYSRFSRMVQTCTDFDNTENPLAQKSRMTRSVDSYITQMEEFEAELAKRKHYEWQA
jgi:uncharacterized protein YfbU (UPF0304 family)